jgi:hypothetical protein
VPPQRQIPLCFQLAFLDQSPNTIRNLILVGVRRRSSPSSLKLVKHLSNDHGDLPPMLASKKLPHSSMPALLSSGFSVLAEPRSVDGASGTGVVGRLGFPAGHRSSNLGAWPVVSSASGALRGEYGVL